MIHPPKYKSFEDKEKIYLDNLCIETEEDLQSTLNRLVSSGRTFIYRGLCDASYKMYTSAQRYWIDNKGAELKNNTFASYADYLQKLIDRSKSLNAVQGYLQKHQVHYNEMWLLALMQHYQAPSIMLDFSHDLYSGLFFMCDGAGDAKGDGSLDDYVFKFRK